MPDREADFLRHICAYPDDTAARLVYADWLEENAGTVPCPNCVDGDVGCDSCEGVGFVCDSPYSLNRLPCPACGPGEGLVGKRVTCHGTGRVSDGRQDRAEFIRVGVALATLESERDWKVKPGKRLRAELLRRRELELLRWEWQKPLWLLFGHPANLCGPLFPVFRSRRGFVEGATCSCADWLARGAAVVACQPVREVELSDRHPTRTLAGWWCYHNVVGAARLPDALYVHLPQSQRRDARRPPAYCTEADALWALSAACVAFARSAAGLPSLRLTRTETTHEP